MKAVRPVIASYRIPYLQMRLVGSYNMSGREKEVKDGEDQKAAVTKSINTFKCHVSCTDGKISVRINLSFYLFFPPLSHPTVVCFFPFENVVLTTKGILKRNIQLLDGMTVEK